MRPGAVYETVIHTAIANCDALVAVIGNNWVDARDAQGGRRIDNPKDLVRIEIAAALAQNKIVVPVLVEDATMPVESELPPDLAKLATRNALLASDHRWDYDVGRLIALLDDVVGPVRPPVPLPVFAPPAAPSVEPPLVVAPAPPSPARRRPIVALTLAILGMVAAGGFVAGTRFDPPPTAGTDVSSVGPGGFPTRPEPQPALPETATVPEVPTSVVAKAGVIPISVGDTVGKGTPAGAGNIATPGAKQRFAFAATAGQIVYLKSMYEGPSSDLGWRLYAPSGTELGGTSMKYDIGRVALSANGTYTIEVAGSASGTGTYAFVVLPVPADVSTPISLGDTVGNGKPPGAGMIASPGARQRFTFAATAGQAVYLKSLFDGSSTDLGWRLYAPSGTELGGTSMKYDIGRVALSATGTYIIEVSGKETGTGTFAFAVSAV